MSIISPSSTPKNALHSVYVLPNTQDIRINQGKRGREDEDDGVLVVDSPKRVKPLEPAGHSKSTPRAIKDARTRQILRTRGPPSIKNASEYLDAMLGYDSDKHYEYGSDSDEEDPTSDPDEPMLSADEDSTSVTHSDEDEVMADISEETFRAEMDQMFVGSRENTFFVTESDSDSDGELADDESEIGVSDADKVAEPGPASPASIAKEVEVIEWEKPGPSPLRHELDLAPDLLKVPAAVRKNKGGPVPIVRSSRHAQGVDRQSARKDAVNRRHCWCMHLPCTDAPWGLQPLPSRKALGKQRAIDDDVVPSFPRLKRGMGCGTPPRFGRWTPLTPPRSRYAYSTSDDAVPLKQFGQAAFHGADAWGVLRRTDRKSTQKIDAQTFEGYLGPLRHAVGPVMGLTREEIELYADQRAVQHWRANGAQLGMMPRVVLREDWLVVTTGMMLEHEARMEALQLMERARAPSPELVLDEDAPMDMVLFEQGDFEELGPWMSSTPEFVVGGTWCQ